MRDFGKVPRWGRPERILTRNGGLLNLLWSVGPPASSKISDVHRVTTLHELEKCNWDGNIGIELDLIVKLKTTECSESISCLIIIYLTLNFSLKD